MRNQTISIVKAFAIIFVVISHCCAIPYVGAFVSLFDVPAFFICSGYFFNVKYLTDEATYLKRRVKGLYWPFVKWSVFFLLIHNLLFHTGILNEQIGNAQGGVLHPYTLHSFCQRLWNIVFNMSGYDDFLAGTFWFFRALFLSSIAMLILFKIGRKIQAFQNDRQIAWGILTVSFLLTLWQVIENLRMTGVPQGGYRDLMGLFFMSIGFLIRSYQPTISANLLPSTPLPSVVSRLKFWITGFLLLILWCIFLPTGMVWRANLQQFLSIPVPAVIGFLLFYDISQYIAKGENIAKKILVLIGDNTLYIFAFHFCSFKLVSALKVWCYGLEWNHVGAHPIVNVGSPWDGFWLLYLLVGVFVPLLWIISWRRFTKKFHINYNKLLILLIQSLRKLCQIVAKYTVIAIKACFGHFTGFFQGFIEIIKASSPKQEDE